MSAKTQTDIIESKQQFTTAYNKLRRNIDLERNISILEYHLDNPSFLIPDDIMGDFRKFVIEKKALLLSEDSAVSDIDTEIEAWISAGINFMRVDDVIKELYDVNTYYDTIQSKIAQLQKQLQDDFTEQHIILDDRLKKLVFETDITLNDLCLADMIYMLSQ